ncbi:MAG: hypothetical protein ACOH2R_15470 [Pseudomonas sp.]
MKNLIESAVFLTSMLAQAEVGIADRHFAAVVERDGSISEEQGNWLWGTEVEPASLTLLIKPEVFHTEPQCVMGRQAAAEMVVDYYMATKAADQRINTPGKIVIKRPARDDRLWLPFSVVCY